MLRIRPKPPSGPYNLNAGTPWSEDDLIDIRDMLRDHRTPHEIAEYLRRDVPEVEAKIVDLWRSRQPAARSATPLPAALAGRRFYGKLQDH
jgi:hypothetical protein